MSKHARTRFGSRLYLSTCRARYADDGYGGLARCGREGIDGWLSQVGVEVTMVCVEGTVVGVEVTMGDEAQLEWPAQRGMDNSMSGGARAELRHA